MPTQLMIGQLPDAAVLLLIRNGCHVLMHPDQFARLFPDRTKALVWQTIEEVLGQ